MKAVAIKSPKEVNVISIEEPKKKPNEVLVQIYAAGICGSDIGAFMGSNPLVSYPRIIGHEVSGVVIEPDEAKSFKAGDRVVLDPYQFCGSCYPCSIGRTNCCTSLKVIGVHIDGAMQERVAYPAKFTRLVPDSLDLKTASLAEPLTIALHAAHRLELKAGEHIAISGAGAIGMLIALVARHYEAVPILIDVLDSRLDYAKDLGIEHVINPARENAQERVKEITKNRGCEAVAEASGANAAIRASIDYASHAGRICFTGWPKNPTELPTNLFTFKELDIRGSRTSAGEFDEALDILDKGAIKPEWIVNKTVSLSEAAEFLQDQAARPECYLKISVELEKE